MKLAPNGSGEDRSLPDGKDDLQDSPPVWPLRRDTRGRHVTNLSSKT